MFYTDSTILGIPTSHCQVILQESRESEALGRVWSQRQRKRPWLPRPAPRWPSWVFWAQCSVSAIYCNIMQYQLQEITGITITIPWPYQDKEVLMSANWILLTTWTHHCFPTNWMLQQCANHSKHIQGAVGSVVGAWSLSKEFAADLTGIVWKLVWTFTRQVWNDQVGQVGSHKLVVLVCFGGRGWGSREQFKNHVGLLVCCSMSCQCVSPLELACRYVMCRYCGCVIDASQTPYRGTTPIPKLSASHKLRFTNDHSKQQQSRLNN